MSAEGEPPTEGDADSERNGENKRHSLEFGEAVARHLAPDLDRMIKNAGKALTRIRISASPSEQVIARILDTSTIREGLRTLIAPVTQQTLISSELPNFQGLLRNLRLKVDLPDFSELFRRFEPDNWHGLAGDVDVRDLLDLAREGWPTTWVPSAVVLRALVRAEPELRHATLIEHQTQVLNDCGDALAVVDTGPSEPSARLMAQAVDALRAGLPGPAQAAAANVLDTLIRTSISPWKGYNSWLRLHPDDDELSMIQLRYAATMAPVRPALEEFWPHRGDPVPALFNRHATSHAVSDIQYTQTNALVGVLLAVSIVREFHQQYTDHIAT